MTLKSKTSRNFFFTIFDHKKFTNETLDAKIKQKELVNISEISYLIEKYDLNTKSQTLSAKVELEVEQDKIVKVKIPAFDSSYFRSNFFC